MTSVAQDLPVVTERGDSIPNVQRITVRNIILAGNDVTESDIILREIHTRENSYLNPEILENDMNRLKNLGLFAKVDVYPIPTDSIGLIDLMFLVEEGIYIIPLPQGGFRNGQLSEFWAGLNLIWRNFRGRNETLNFSFGIGSDPFVGASYTIPWIGRDEHYFLSGSVRYSKNINKSLETIQQEGNEIPDKDENYSLHNFRASIVTGKYFSTNFSVTGSLAYNSLITSQYEPGRTVSTDGRDRFFNLSMSMRFDTRNSYDYTTEGELIFVDYTKEGFGGLIDFNRVTLDARKFIPLKLSKDYELSLGISALSDVSFGGQIPPYMREFFGYDKVIRGHKKLVYEGDNRLGFFNELRIPIISERYFKGDNLPVFNKVKALKNMSYRFAMYTTVFFDIGAVWNKHDLFSDSKFHNGFGAGLNFVLPFGLIGRTDFAFRIEGKRYIPQVVFDLDAAF